MKEAIYIAGDHAGFEFKEKLKKYFDKKKIKYEDLGAHVLDSDDDYPDFAFKLGEQVSNENAKGILICGSGAGMMIAANKVKGVRAVEAYDVYTAKKSREDNDANVLTLRARGVEFGKIIKIVDAWLNTKFSDEERHSRRIRMIEEYENNE